MRRVSVLITIFLLIALSVFSVYYFRSNSLCVENVGFAFGLHFSYFEIISFLLLLSLVLLSLKVEKFIGYNMLVIAIFGFLNTLERVLFGSICDYISLFGLVVNIADIVITLVCTCLCIYFIKKFYEGRNRE